jgi:hypothetical protein
MYAMYNRVKKEHVKSQDVNPDSKKNKSNLPLHTFVATVRDVPCLSMFYVFFFRYDNACERVQPESFCSPISL